MAKKKVLSKKVKATVAKEVKSTPEPMLQNKTMHEKKQIMLHGIGLHLITYLLLSILIYLLGAQAMVSVILFMVLFWGLFVMSYAYYYHK